MKPEEVTKDTFPKYKPNPLLESLPDAVKDPKNYDRIQRELLDTLASGHSHSELSDWVKCVACQGRVRDHKNMMVGLGFKKKGQYMAWKKTQEFIKKEKLV